MVCLGGITKGSQLPLKTFQDGGTTILVTWEYKFAKISST